MKTRILLVGLVLLAAVASPAGESKAPPVAELANETADLSFDARNLTLYTVLLTVGLALAMFALMEIGQRIGTRHLTPDLTETRKGLAAVDGAVFSLLGLLIAFSFYGAAGRFDARRELVIQEADRIGTAWLRLDLLDGEERSALRELFRQYLDARLNTYQLLPHTGAVRAEIARSLTLQEEIWRRALAACREPVLSPAGAQLIPALNQMFEIAHTRVGKARIHPPKIIFAMLVTLTLISALLIGHGMAGRKSRSWTHSIGFVATMTAAIFLIFELEYPRLGLVRIDAMDQVLVELRQRME